MKIENKYDAPASFISFCMDDQYSSGECDYSATQLIDEPRIVEFTKRYPELIIDDPWENPWKFVSTIFHGLMEQYSPDGEVPEQRLFGSLDGSTISGAMDVQVVDGDLVTIGDYKMTTVYGVSDLDKFTQQLNIYAWLVESSTAKTVIALQVYALLRDWKISMAEKMRGYPATPGITIEIPLWSYYEREKFIKEKISSHSGLTDLPDDELPECSHEGRWPTGTVYTVTSVDDDSVSYFDRKGDADKYVNTLDPSSQISSVVGKTFADYRRCKSYCHFTSVCNSYSEFKNERSEYFGGKKSVR